MSRVRDGERVAAWQASVVDESLRAQGAPDEVLLQAISLPPELPSYVLGRALEGCLVDHPRIAFVHSAAMPRASLQAIRPGEASPLHPPLQTLPMADELGVVLVVKEWLPAVPLLTWRELRGDRVRLSDVLDVIETLSEAVGALHARGFVHGALTPDIVGLQPVEAAGGQGATGRTWVVKLLELGLVRMLTPREGWPDRIASLWCAPEAFAPDASTDLRLADQLSIAAMLFALCTDQLPFDPIPAGTPANEAAELRRRQIEQLAPPRGNDRARALGVTPALSAACLRALSPRPEERFPSVEAFAKAIREAGRGEARRAQPSGGQGVSGTVPSSVVASLFRRPAVFASETLPSIVVAPLEPAPPPMEAVPKEPETQVESLDGAQDAAPAETTDEASNDTPKSVSPVAPQLMMVQQQPGADSAAEHAASLGRMRRLCWGLGIGWAATLAYLLVR